MLKNETEKGGSGTFMGRLFDVSKNNPQFTTEDIFAETATILTGVCLIRTFCLVRCSNKNIMIFRRQIHLLQRLHL